MSKKTNISAWRIEIIPEKRWISPTVADEKTDCDRLAAEIRRHCDGVGSIAVLATREEICEHCGRAWTEDSGSYNGGCCNKDVDEEDTRTAKESA